MRPGTRLLITLSLATATLAWGWYLAGPLVLTAARQVLPWVLLAWVAHVLVHELAHLVAALTQDFEVLGLALGPFAVGVFDGTLRLRLVARVGGAVAPRPRGVRRLSRRLRIVAAAGPAATALATLGCVAWYLAAGAPGLASPPGVFAVIGGVTLVSAVLSSRLLPRPPPGGTDVEMLVQPRRVLAHWTYAAVLQGVGAGKAVADVVTPEQLEPLLPPEGATPEAIDVVWFARCFEAGDFARPRARLEHALKTTPEEPQWLRTDVHHQAGCVFALVDGDAARAEACLPEVQRFQQEDWYQDLLVACIAEAKGEAAKRDAAFERWMRTVKEHPRGRFAMGGNHWVVRELERRREERQGAPHPA